jgi:hypothetical protein
MQDIYVWKEYTPEEFPSYDNFDAIEVSKVKNIPIKFNGLMGVPITFVDQYCPEQFEIIGLWNDKRDPDPAFIKGEVVNLDPEHPSFVGPVLSKKATYARIIIRYKDSYLQKKWGR